jgi:hypothetical protein
VDADALVVDGAPDGPSSDATYCYGAGIVSYCAPAMPSGSLIVSGAINTDADVRCQGTSLCMFVAHEITISAQTNVSGTRPFVLVAATTLTVDAPVLVTAGAMSGCSPTTAAVNDAGGAGGGAGGSFQGKGGNGGMGGAGVGGAGAVAANGLASPPTTLRGGCAGSRGGNAGTTGASGGAGGGAIYLIAGGSIDITSAGYVVAPGFHGSGAMMSAGGGGAGSGGYIGLDAPALTCNGVLSANGGGGGEGAGQVQNGNDGNDATNPTMVASGATAGTIYGGNGGDGSFNTTLTGGPGLMQAAGTTGGGGGGGGGAGFIKVYGGGSVSGCSVSPPAL